jgi:hypothetical protein
MVIASGSLALPPTVVSSSAAPIKWFRKHFTVTKVLPEAGAKALTVVGKKEA